MGRADKGAGKSVSSAKRKVSQTVRAGDKDESTASSRSAGIHNPDGLRSELSGAVPDKALMRAVLVDAIKAYMKGVHAPPSSKQRMDADEEERWFERSDPGWPFSFESICQALEISPDPVRRYIRQLKEGRKKTE